MERQAIALSICALVTQTGCQQVRPPTVTASSLQAELARIDLYQSNVVQSGDMTALEALIHSDYTVHAPTGQILDRERTLALARTGLFAREKHRRVQERVVITGDIGIVMGVDYLDSPPPLATRGELKRRYTNVFVRTGGRWRHLSRHFHFIP